MVCKKVSDIITVARHFAGGYHVVEEASLNKVQKVLKPHCDGAAGPTAGKPTAMLMPSNSIIVAAGLIHGRTTLSATLQQQDCKCTLVSAFA
jgi:hypothetical protein